MAQVNLGSFGYANSVDVTGNATLALTTHSGKVANVTATATLTLPAVGAAHHYIVRVGAPDITVTISPNSSDLIAGAGAANAGVGADDKDVVFTNQEVGSFVELAYADATGWKILNSCGTFTFQS